MSLPPELAFLSDFFEPPETKLQVASWLKTDFAKPVWKCDLGKSRLKIIDWHVILPDASLLTDAANGELLNGLKYFLTTTVRDSFGVSSLGDASTSLKLYRALHIADHLLMDANHYGLLSTGLAGLTARDLKRVIITIAQVNDISESVYKWNARLSEYCLTAVAETDSSILSDYLNERPYLSVITDAQRDEDDLGLPLDQIPKIRAALDMRGLYSQSNTFGYAPNGKKISSILYQDCLHGRDGTKPTPSILCYTKISEPFVRELDCIPVTTAINLRVSPADVGTYKTMLYGLGCLHKLGLPAPASEDLASMMSLEVESSTEGRFRSVPTRIIFTAIKDAIEFHLKYGKPLLNSYCRLAILAKRKGKKLTSLSEEDFNSCLSPKLRDYGVTQLGLSCRVSGVKYPDRIIKGNKQKYFKKLRANNGLLELISVYYGAIQVTTGALTARRVGELIDLPCQGCLDSTLSWLLFNNRKSTKRLGGLRLKEARPVDPIAVEMIQAIQQFQKRLERIGFISGSAQLFAAPSLRGDKNLGTINKSNFNRQMDIFCDYFQSEVNEIGHRYYLRQHQLRRFFAQVFFHCCREGGVETLQWMLGHTNLSHVWNYISENFEGSLVRGAQGQVLAQELQGNKFKDYSELADLLTKEYGITDFQAVDADELADHIEGLIEKKKLTVNPHFFKNENGEMIELVLIIRKTYKNA
jgi:hypothetical protein